MVYTRSILSIKKIERLNEKVVITFETYGDISRYFVENVFIAEYSVTISSVPDQIILIPFLSTVLPICWATKTEVYVPIIDETYAISIKAISEVLQLFYPDMHFCSKVYPKTTAKSFYPNECKTSKAMMLFSGGVDSLATYMRHKDEQPVLVCIHGADIGYYNMADWQVALKNAQSFAHVTGCKLETVRSNFKQIISFVMLIGFREKIHGDWWSYVMHAFAMLGLCAPLTFVEGTETLYIAASYTYGSLLPFGSHPLLDNKVKWGPLAVFHDGLELNREEKLMLIGDYSKRRSIDIFIRSCFDKTSEGANCSRCEKCSRTIVGLELAGYNPENFGFKLCPDTFHTIKRKLETHEWYFNEGMCHTWKNLQRYSLRNMNLPHKEASVLIKWLVDANIECLKSGVKLPQMLSNIILPVLNALPVTQSKVACSFIKKIARLFYISV
jgi:hypothetical protein